MTATDNQDELEVQFAQWRQYVQRRRELRSSDADELEDHLRGSVDELLAAGLSADEAFLVAVKRMGSLDELSREFAREHSERLWKQLVLTGDTAGAGADTRSRRDLWVMVACAMGAAASVKVPALFGMSLDKDAAFYGPNLSLFALPWLAGYLAWRRQAGRRLIGVLVAMFALGAAAANVYQLAEAFEPVQQRVQQPLGPVQLTTGQLVDPPEDGVAVTLPLGQDAEHHRCRRGGHQILGDLHQTPSHSTS